MTRHEWIEYCLTFPDAYEDYPFDSTAGIEGAWTVMRHRQNKKSFALIFQRNGLCINLKCDPMQADFYRRIYQSVTPGYHMNKVHWNTVLLNGDVDTETVYDMITQSYALTQPKQRGRGQPEKV